MTQPLHHLLLRKRKHEKLEPYPHPNKFKNFMDKLVYAAGLLGPIMTVPQIYIIWAGKNASGVSVLTWCAYLAGASLWFIYGLLHKEKPIMVANGSAILVFILVIIGAMVYG